MVSVIRRLVCRRVIDVWTAVSGNEWTPTAPGAWSIIVQHSIWRTPCTTTAITTTIGREICVVRAAFAAALDVSTVLDYGAHSARTSQSVCGGLLEWFSSPVKPVQTSPTHQTSRRTRWTHTSVEFKYDSEGSSPFNVAPWKLAKPIRFRPFHVGQVGMKIHQSRRITSLT